MNASGSQKKRDTSTPKASGSNRADSGRAALKTGERWLKPAPDKRRPGLHLMVRDPVTLAVLPAEGAAKKSSRYWTRRLMCGDVFEG